MASIYATNSSSSTSTSGLKGYGGLASGLDRDSLIEAMTTGTRSKIAKQKQKIQSLKWKQEAYQNISSKLIEFSSTYLSMSSKKSLISSSFFAKSDITVNGTNSKYVKVSGYSNISDSLAINGVKQLAKKASYTTGSIESQGLETGVIDFSKEQSVDVLAGTTLKIKYGSGNVEEEYTITLKKDGDYSTSEKAVESLNASLKEVEGPNGKTLAEYMEFSQVDGMLTLTDKQSNGIKIVGGDAAYYLGYGDKEDGSGLEDGSVSLIASREIISKKEVKLLDYLPGKTVDFMYNGTSVSVELGEITGNDNAEQLKSIQQSLQDAFDKKIGLNRISVELEVDAEKKPVKLVFKTKLPDEMNEDGSLKDDTTSILKVTGGTAPLDALGLSVGDSNHLNLNSKVSNFMGNAGTDSTYSLEINGKPVDITGNDTIQDVIDKINKSDAKVKVTYLETANRFQITSTEEGASGRISIDTSEGLAKKLFGGGNTESVIEESGQDAIINVSYDGVETEIRRSSNTFDLEGLAVTVSGEFGYTGDNLDKTAEAVTFSAKADTEKVMDSVKEMVEAYNSIIETVNKEISTKPNRSYTPLTDEQKEEMSESQIEKWEEKAKEGLLFNDSDLSSLASSMRFVLTQTGLNYTELEKMGITTSTNASDNGKLVLDEDKLTAALETEPTLVQKLFAGDGTSNGLMTNIKNVFDQYAKKEGSSKGILVDKAGSSLAPLSLLTNTIYKQLEDMDKTLKSLQTYLTTEQDRYISKFASLETVIAQMNSQSSWLSQQFSA